MKKATKKRTLDKKLSKVPQAPALKAKGKARPAKKTVAKPAIPDIPDIPDYDAYLDAEYLVNCWDCSTKDAQAAVESVKPAILKELIQPLMGGASPKDPAALERTLIAMLGHHPTELMKVLVSCPELAERMNADPAGFAFRLQNFHETKKTGVRHVKSYPEWKASLLAGWITFSKGPPLCLWSDGALATTFKAMPAEETVRQFISRAGLVRPKSPRFGVEELRIHGRQAVRFVKRAGGTFGKKT